MNQNAVVLAGLKRRKVSGLDTVYAIKELYILRLASRIYDLSLDGYTITKDMAKGYATYYLDEKHWYEK